MAKKRRDQLGVVGFASALLRNVAQQRSLKKVRDAKNAKLAQPEKPKEKRPKDTRSPEQIRSDVDETRVALVKTVEKIKYDLDVPSRARDLRDRVAADIPSELRGRVPALITSGSILAVGLGSIAAAVTARVRR